MTAIRVFIQRNPVLCYFALVFAISYSGFLAVVGPTNIPVTFATLGPGVHVAILAGPTVAGLLVTGLVYGRKGLRTLLSRLLKWRVRGRWYAVALLTAPLLTATANFALSLFSPESPVGAVTTDGLTSLLLFAIAAGLMYGIFEELGWTGFAVPELRRRYGVFTTAMVVGLVWGAWHFLLFLESDSFSGALPLALLLVRLFSWLPAYRVLMVWVYDRTESLLVAMLMHTSLVATQVLFRPPAASAGSQLISILIWAAMLWAAVAVIAVADRGHLSRPPLPKWAA